ncbi:hypothetical protein HA466_0317440 [Hirschfeldia incana]|nr:hypothetical protein HA466_0317440 [Hirschfeldia incana]
MVEEKCFWVALITGGATEIVKRFGTLDILINNAGLSGAPCTDIRNNTLSEFMTVFDVNVKGASLGMKHAARVMIPAKKALVVLWEALVHILTLDPSNVILGLTRSVAAELGQHGIRVNCVSPYAVATKLALAHSPEEERTDDALSLNRSKCGFEPTRVAEIVKDRPSWFRECRAVDVMMCCQPPMVKPLSCIALCSMHNYVGPPRDFSLLRYTSVLEDGRLVVSSSEYICIVLDFLVPNDVIKFYYVCERSLKSTQNGPSMPPVQHFVRAEMLPTSQWACSVPEVLRPLYESPKVLAQKTTMAALRQLKQIAQESSQTNTSVNGWGRRPATLRALSQRLSRGFNEAVNGFTDEGWSVIVDSMDDVTITVNSSPDKLMGLNLTFSNGFAPVSNVVLCAKASMLLQNVPPGILLRFLREHRSEWADNNIDAYLAAAVKVGPCSARVGGFGGQVILPLAHTIEHEEFMEVIKLEGLGHSPEDAIVPKDIFLLQLCSGMDENAVGTCAELIFAPIDASFADDAPLLPSGFRIIPLDSTKKEASSPNRTLDLASALEIGSAGTTKASTDQSRNSTCARSVMTIAFEFGVESHMQEHVASMARQYVRGIISSVQRVALALSPSHISSQVGLRTPLGTPEAQTLARWICQSYRSYMGAELLKSNSEGNESILKNLWHHTDAIICCSMKVLTQISST